jgi:hypothetical protein
MEDHTIARSLINLGAGVAQQETTDRLPAGKARLVVGGFGLGFAAIGAAVKLFGPKRATWPDTVGDALLGSGVTMLGQASTNLVDTEVLHLAPSGQSLEAVLLEVPTGSSATVTPPQGASIVNKPTFAQATAAFDSFEIA